VFFFFFFFYIFQITKSMIQLVMAAGITP